MRIKTIQLKLKTLFLLLLLGFAFSSCSKDDSEPENQAPNSFRLNDVADGVGLQPQLTWEAAKDADGDDVTYQVYLDTLNPPQITISRKLKVNTFNIKNALDPETTYYWRVMAKDSNRNTTESNINSFTTRDMTTAETLVGKWFYESIEGEPPLTACEKNIFLLFTKDLFLKLKNYSEGSNGECLANGESSATYELTGNNQIKVSGNGSIQTWEIQSISKTELLLDLDNSTMATFKKE